MVGAAAKPANQPQQAPQKGRQNSQERESRTQRSGVPAVWIRVIVSILVIWHFSGVFLAALSIAPSSDLVIEIAQKPPMQWYLDALYLNQGHSFFAPEVGPGHLIRYELFDQSGQVVEQGELPSRKEHWPRLRYHRHFMLADQSILPGPQEYSDHWQRRYLESFARHLLRVHPDAQSVRVRRIAHWPLPRILVAEQHRELDDPEGYEQLMEVIQRRSDLQPEGKPGGQERGGVDTAGLWNGAAR